MQISDLKYGHPGNAQCSAAILALHWPALAPADPDHSGMSPDNPGTLKSEF